jgi:hypothetical protein
MKQPNIKIRIGAAYDEVTVDGVSFDRATMPKKDKHFLRNVIRDGYFKGRAAA